MSLYYVNNPLNSLPKNSWRQRFWWYGTSCSMACLRACINAKGEHFERTL